MVEMASEAGMFGSALKRWREKRKLTQEGLAFEAGITSSYAGQLERGAKVPSLTVVLKLCDALNCTPGDLLSDFTLSAIRKLFK